MATYKLSDARIRAIKPGLKALKLFDGGGLFIAVLPSGSKSWRLQYRVGGRPQTATLGTYPEFSLAEARRWAQETRSGLARGIEPTRRRSPPERQTLAGAVRDYWSAQSHLSEGYRTNAVRALERHILPALGGRHVGSITRADVMDALTQMDKAGLHVYVRKTRRWLSTVLDWCVEHGHCETNVCLSIRPRVAFARAQTEHHASIDLAEVGEFMRRLTFEGALTSTFACRLLALTWVRTGELRGMRWAEIDGDLWRIPKERMKMRNDHLVPLSAQAMALLDRMPRISEFVFPNDRRPIDRPMSENAVLYMIGRIGYGGRMTGHGWRTLASTWAHEHGFLSDAIERQLAHVRGDVRAIYNRAEHLPVRRQMLQAWANWLDQQESQTRVPQALPAASTAA